MPVQSPDQEDPLEESMATRYSCLEIPMDRGAWRGIVCRVTKSQTWLKWLSSMHKHLYICFLFFNLFVSLQKKSAEGFVSSQCPQHITELIEHPCSNPSWCRLHQGVTLGQQPVRAGHPWPGGSLLQGCHLQQLPQPKVLLSQILF